MGIVFLLIPLILRNRSRFAQRAPDLHHTHKTPIPRLGGLALAAAFLGVEAFVAVFFPEQGMARERWVVMGSSLAMFGLGLWDDLRPLGAKRKLLCQLLIAAVVCSFGIGIQTFKIPFTGTIINLSAWGVLLTMLWLVAMTNLINLIDGVDGLAGGISLMLMALLAFVGYQHGFGLIACGMVGALLGFLWFNFPPAKIYLGDGGAYFLGFQIGLLTLVSSQKGTVVAALVAPLFVMALPIVDTTLAIVRRGLRGLPIFRPDRKHIHHRLMDMGLSRRKVVLSLYAVTLIFLGMGFTVFMSDGYWIPALLGLALLLMLLCAGRLSFSREWFSVGRVLGNSLSMPGHSVCVVSDAVAGAGRRAAQVAGGAVDGFAFRDATAGVFLGETDLGGWRTGLGTAGCPGAGADAHYPTSTPGGAVREPGTESVFVPDGRS